MGEEKPSPDPLLGVLRVFKKGRSFLVERFLEQEPELYESLFKYENDKAMMELSRERERVLWLNAHMALYEEEKAATPGFDDDRFFCSFSELVSLVSNCPISEDSDVSRFVAQLISRKESLIKSLLEKGDASERNLRYLSVSYERDKSLFERKFKKLIRERDVNSTEAG